MNARAVTFAIGFTVALNSHHAHAQGAVPITAEHMRQRIEAFSNDSMLGRGLAGAGHVRATNYIAAELKRLHVPPFGENYTYFQTLPVTAVRLDLENARLGSHGIFLQPGTDFVPIVTAGGVPFPMEVHVPNLAQAAVAPVHVGAVFGGVLGAANAISPDSAIGRVVVFLPPARPDGQPDYQVSTTAPALAAYERSGAVLIEGLELMPRRAREALLGLGLRTTRPDSFALRLPPVVMVTHSAGETIAVGLSGELTTTVSFASKTTDPRAPVRNVLAMIDGSDLTLRSEFVVLTARSDHLGIADSARRIGADSIANGADAGSGAMALLEIAGYIASLREKPKRSIVFVWTAGGESGSLGTDYFLSHPDLLARGQIVAAIDIGAISRGAPADLPGGGPDYVQIAGARRLSTDLGQLLGEVSARPELGLRVDSTVDAAGHPLRLACHGSIWAFQRFGIPAAFVTTGAHPDADEVTDEAAHVDADKAARVARFLASAAVELANRPSRPRVQSPPASVRASCTQ